MKSPKFIYRDYAVYKSLLAGYYILNLEGGVIFSNFTIDGIKKDIDKYIMEDKE